MGDQTSSTTIPPPSPQEQQLLQLVSGTLIPQYLKTQGYDVKTTTASFEDSDQYKQLMKAKSDAETAVKNYVPKPNAGQGTTGATSLPDNTPQKQLDDINNQIATAKAKFQPYTTYDVGEKETPQTQYLKDKYGADSKQYLNQKAADKKTAADEYTQQQETYKTFQDKVSKYMNGDYSLTPQESETLSKSMTSVKASLDNIFKPELDATTAAFGDFTQKAGKGGLTTEQALGAVGSQIEKTGVDMNKALDNVVATREALLKQGITDATGEITKKVSANAASLGRDPSDPEFQADIQTEVAKQVKTGQLQLADMQSQDALKISQQTGVALQGVAEKQASLRTGVASEESQDLSRIDPRTTGGIPGQLQVGQGGGQYADALLQQRLQNASSAQQVPLNLFNQYQQERMAQPTTTTSQDAFSQYLSGGLGIASGVAGAYSGISSAGSLRSIASSYAGGGGGGATYTDANMPSPGGSFGDWQS